MADVKILEYSSKKSVLEIERELEEFMDQGFELKAFTDTGPCRTFVMVREFIPYITMVHGDGGADARPLQ